MLFARLFKFLVFSAFGINAILLTGAILSPYIDPANFWIIALLGLFFKIFVGAHLFFVLVFLIGKLYKLAIFSLLVLLFCFPPLIHSVGIHTKGNADPGKHLKIMTYNVDNFGFFSNPKDSAEIVATIKEESPDILCFQEYFTNPKSHRSMVSRFKKLGYKYYYEYLTESQLPDNGEGQAIFSRIPFHHIHGIPFYNTANGAFYADFYINNDSFRLYNLHYQSISLRQYETKIPSSLNDFKTPQKAYYRMLFTKLMWAFKARSEQVKKVKQSLDNCRLKTIVCGDFNDTPVSYTYHQMTEKLDDTFLGTNFGFGSTFAGRIPLQRIDYILVSPEIKTGQTRVVHNPGSDHFPVVSEFYW